MQQPRMLTYVNKACSKHKCLSQSFFAGTGHIAITSYFMHQIDKNQLLADYAQGKRSFKNLDLRKIQLFGQTLKDIDFSGSNLSESYLAYSNLSNANFKGAILNNAQLEQVNMNGANLQNAMLKEVNLFRASLYGANLSKATLAQVDLRSADLQQASLIKTELRKVNLRDSTLTGAKFTQAQLIHSELFRAHGANLTDALIDSNTTMPNGFPSDLQP